MKLSVVGTGNVGAALLFPLGTDEAIERVGVISRKEETANAAIMDVASANPTGASKMHFDKGESLSDADLIVITSGMSQKGKGPEETHAANLQIALEALQTGPLNKRAIVICLATPVDYLTAEVCDAIRLPAKQVIGFGGDLDTNRLRFVLNSHGIESANAHAVGEHGPSAIPIYGGEAAYPQITKELRDFWLKIARNVDVVRNLATADLLGRLVHSIATNSNQLHNVCAFHPEHGLYLTWPFAIGSAGSEEPLVLNPGPEAQALLNDLIANRKKSLPAAVI